MKRSSGSTATSAVLRGTAQIASSNMLGLVVAHASMVVAV
jgi:hypothetical protein